jgi:2-polyprenyl-3-methyl-5-hydroxy-6-metoxy-1,4-benzoquinol methylase
VAVLDRLEASTGRILDIGIRVAIGQLEGGARPGAELVGIDISAEMVAQAKAADRSGPVLGRRHGPVWLWRASRSPPCLLLSGG